MADNIKKKVYGVFYIGHGLGIRLVSGDRLITYHHDLPCNPWDMKPHEFLSFEHKVTLSGTFIFVTNGNPVLSTAVYIDSGGSSMKQEVEHEMHIDEQGLLVVTLVEDIKYNFAHNFCKLTFNLFSEASHLEIVDMKLVYPCELPGPNSSTST